MKRIPILFCALLFASNSYATNIFYISPGINISWNLKGNIIFGPKLSFGVYEKQTFYNITFGFLSSDNMKLYPYYYIEGQIGKLSDPMEFRKLQIFTGLGIGIGIHPVESNSISYRASLFGGFGVFGKASFVYKEELAPDFGFEAVLPIPINYKFGSPGGLK